MKIWKKYISLMIGVLLVFSLVACGKSNGSTETTANQNTNQQTETTQAQANTDSQAATESKTQAESVSEKESQSQGKIVITDQTGKTITFDEPPQRLATTIMPFPYIFHAVMGNNDHMIGCNPSSMIAYEDSALRHMYPKMAEANTGWVDKSFVVNVEELLMLKPDVVFQWNHKPEEIEKMEAAGLKVIALKYGTLEDLETWIRIIAQLYQKEARGEEIIRYFHESVQEVQTKLADVKPSDYPTIIQLSQSLQVSGTGFGNYWMEQSGAKNPAKELSGDDRKVNMEQILEWNPDILYIGNFTDIKPSDILENKLEGQDWSLVKAVKNRQVYKIPIGGYRWDPPGVETPLMIKWCAKIQHPEIFADLDMRHEVSEFYKKVYNFTLTEDMLAEILDDTQE